jgi:hypothetical protein
MNYRFLHNNSSGKPIYALIEDDGSYKITCSEENPDFQRWISEGNTPLPAEENQ